MTGPDSVGCALLKLAVKQPIRAGATLPLVDASPADAMTRDLQSLLASTSELAQGDGHGCLDDPIGA
jgi:hypothetical protein